jgi:hypothetical protein
MEFSFGIITNNNNIDNLYLIINSIKMLGIEKYEIIIVGGNKIFDDKNVRHICYLDKSNSGDISIKKNIITNESIYKNIVYMHDYIIFNKDWYDGFLKFGDGFDVCMNRILNLDGSRYRDWCFWKDDSQKYINSNNCLLSYEITHLTNMMYISGAYWVAKKDFMLKNKLNEKLSWGQGEDVEWSIRARKNTSFKMNTFSSVSLLKQKDRIFNETTQEENKILNNLLKYDDSKSYENLINNHLKNWI